MNRFLFIVLTLFFISFNVNAQQTKTQRKALKKLAKEYKVGKVQNGVVTIQTKKDKLYGLASIEGTILIMPKFVWISNQNNVGHYLTAMQKRSSPNDGGGSFPLELSQVVVYDSSGQAVNPDSLKGMKIQLRSGGKYGDEYLRAIKNSEGKIGLINGSGKFLIEPKYDFIGAPNKEGLGYLFDNNLYGVYDLAKNSIGSISYTPPISDKDIKEGLGFKGANQPALNWRIKNGYIIISSDGVNFGLINHGDGSVVFKEEYNYNFEQQDYTYVESETFKKGALIKAKNTNHVSLYDSKTKEIFFDLKDLDINDVGFFKPDEKPDWVYVTKGYKHNLYNVGTKSFLLDTFQKRISQLNKNIVIIEKNDLVRMFSIAKGDYIGDKGYKNVQVISRKKTKSTSSTESPKEYYVVQLGKKYGVVDDNGKELTKIIYNNIPSIELGIVSLDKKKILQDYIILFYSKHIKSRNEKGQLSSRTETKCSVLNVGTGDIVLDGGNDVIYDGKYLVKVDKERDPVTNAKIKYYTAYSLDGNMVSENKGYKL